MVLLHILSTMFAVLFNNLSSVRCCSGPDAGRAMGGRRIGRLRSNVSSVAATRNNTSVKKKSSSSWRPGDNSTVIRYVAEFLRPTRSSTSYSLEIGGA
ncbi:unnamed protein product [Ceratitis capitata]|uniref:(Mediterranean fruit fly) hypothetical protein n=1 Tax=Ceratitis capitata TaxID=7213 RepID=A0A811V090_CERCA|nr:unnamed protein product [Ceratitis capitata]